MIWVSKTLDLLHSLGINLLAHFIATERSCPHCAGTEFVPYRGLNDGGPADDCVDYICTRCGLDLPQGYFYPWDLLG